ncbi:tetratricopeptide repeat protein [Actinomadura madurae]|uniref:tetratricopeptide repeat protein n=1 Tax=Actinomadura madurae TaxID=1993 RepID=UPI0020D25496|nr:tetratricopeptide repeat protein [Actinomadura madurae]MCP9979930.1 hypothetical protein [Actinomadura madurae]
MTAEDVYALMTRSQELPYGEARTVLVEDALRRAEAAGDEVLAYRVRVRLTDAYQFGGEPAKAFATFSRSLAEHDRDPGRFDEEHFLLWQMKGMVGALTLFPEIPLDRTYAVLDDMERRYLAGGHSLQAVYRRRHLVARHIGDGTADDWYAKWRAARRDELSDCEGCDPTGMVNHLVETGRHEEAAEIAAPVLAARLTCNEQPQSIRTAMMPVFLRTRRPELAADAHRRAYRVHRSRLADLSDIADHLEFCAVTGNEARGLEIVQRHLGWLDRAPSAHAEMRFAAAAALVLDRVAAAGHGAATVRRPAADGRPAADVPLPDLREELRTRATDLADRFDARNGTSRQGDLVRATLAAEPFADFVPLAAHHRRPAPAPAPRPVPQEDFSGEDDLDALLDIADERRTRQDIARTLAAWRRFDALAETTEPTPLQRARRLDAQGVAHAVEGDYEEAVACWHEAARRFAELGDETRRHRVLSRLGGMRVQTGDKDGLQDVVAAAEYFAHHPDDDGAATGSLLRLATAHVELGNPEDAVAALDRIAGDDAPDRAGLLWGTTPTPPEEHAGEAWFVRGQALLRLGDADGAAEALRRSARRRADLRGPRGGGRARAAARPDPGRAGERPGRGDLRPAGRGDRRAAGLRADARGGALRPRPGAAGRRPRGRRRPRPRGGHRRLDGRGVCTSRPSISAWTSPRPTWPRTATWRPPRPPRRRCPASTVTSQGAAA